MREKENTEKNKTNETIQASYVKYVLLYIDSYPVPIMEKDVSQLLRKKENNKNTEHNIRDKIQFLSNVIVT